MPGDARIESLTSYEARNFSEGSALGTPLYMCFDALYCYGEVGRKSGIVGGSSGKKGIVIRSRGLYGILV